MGGFIGKDFVREIFLSQRPKNLIDTYVSVIHDNPNWKEQISGGLEKTVIINFPEEVRENVREDYLIKRSVA